MLLQSPPPFLPPSQGILATTTLLPSLLASAVKLPSSITLFTNQMAATSAHNRPHVSTHPFIAMAVLCQPQDRMDLRPHPVQLEIIKLFVSFHLPATVGGSASMLLSEMGHRL